MKYLVSICALAVVTGCELMPDSFTPTLRTGNRVGIQGVNFSVTYNNPWKPRKVHEEYISAEGAFFGGDAP